MPEQICPSCKSEMKLREGFSKKTGKPYSFWGCTNYPACDKTLPNLNRKLVSGSTPTPNAVPGAKQSDKTAFEIEVVSLLKEIRDSLKTKFPEPDDSEFGA